jgi:hypothetical protein
MAGDGTAVGRVGSGGLMKAVTLEGAQLDYWVAKSAGLRLLRDPPGDGDDHDADAGTWHPKTYHPSTDWSQGGQIVADEWYDIEDFLFAWFGPGWTDGEAFRREPLTWFMRAYVAASFGEEFEGPGNRLAAEWQGAVDWARSHLKRLRAASGRVSRGRH